MMLVKEIVESQKIKGRAFNHLEDLVFFHGSDGALEAIQHLKDITGLAGSKSIRFKWDGSPQVYFGREKKNGPLFMAGHNGWARGVKSTSAGQIQDFIANQSGKAVSPQDVAKRKEFAKEFASWYNDFDQATPRDFVGFVYVDMLFFQRPVLDKQGVYTFCPNPKSETCYHVRADSDLGKKISQARLMAVGHGYFPSFGMGDHEQKPLSDFSKFNANPNLIILGPIYNSVPIKLSTAKIDRAEAIIKQNAQVIDAFLAPMAGLSDLKDILYRYVNQTARAKDLDNISTKHFTQWLGSSTVSASKQNRIQELINTHKHALESMFKIMKMIRALKDQTIKQAETQREEIWDTNGEGRVRYADANKKYGNVKFVPRWRWTP